MTGILGLLVSLLLFVIIVAVILWVIGLFGLDAQAMKLARIIVGAIALILLLDILWRTSNAWLPPSLR